MNLKNAKNTYNKFKKIFSIVAYQLYTFLFNILILSQKIPNKYKRNGPITFVF